MYIYGKTQKNKTKIKQKNKTKMVETPFFSFININIYKIEVRNKKQ